MDISAGDVLQFIVVHKWWLIALIPFAIVIVALKIRG